MNNFKGIGWFVLELYTPTPSKYTTYMDAEIDVKTDKKSVIDNHTIKDVNIDVGSKYKAKINTNTNDDVMIQTKTKFIARGK